MEKKNVFYGFLGSAILLIVYFSILTIGNNFEHAVSQFFAFWYWILLLVIGFGFQVGLYSYIRRSIRNMKGAKAEVVASGGISTGSMIACCAHHLSDVLPIIGLSAASLFLIKYQLFLTVLGVGSNLVGITIMLGIMQEHELHKKNSKLFKINMKNLMNIVILISLIALVLVFFQSV